MKSRFGLFLFSSFAYFPILAQNTYTGHLRSSQAGKGTIVIVQSEAIEQVVNNTPKTKSKTSAWEKPEAKPHTHPVSKNPTGGTATPSHFKSHAEESSRKEENASHSYSSRASDTASRSSSTSHPTGVRRYEERIRHKAQGYRICIFTGGNSRQDKNEAIQMGNKCRAKFGELAVYPSFIAPRWVTYVGDFRTHQDAQKYVTLIRRSRISYEVRIVKSEVNLPY